MRKGGWSVGVQVSHGPRSSARFATCQTGLRSIPLQHTSALCLFEGLSFTHRRCATQRKLVSPEIFLSGLLDKALHQAFPQLPPEDRAVVVPANSAKSDAAYQCSAPLALGKKINENPTSIAERMVQFLNRKEEGGLGNLSSTAISDASVARGGFIYLHLKSEWLAERVYDARHLVNRETNYFPFALPEGDVLSSGEKEHRQKKVLIDFASPNMAKELHVGHLRSIAQGDALSNCLEYVGHNVDRISHVGDFGTPMGMVVARMLELAETKDMTAVPSPAELSIIYVEAKKRFDESPAFAKRALEAAAELQKGKEGNKEIYDLYQRVCEGSRKGFDEIYNKLGVRVEERGESFYAPLLPGVVDELLQKKIATINNGAVCVFFEGSSVPMIIQKSDGAYLYATTDLAALKQRATDLKKDWIIYVTDDSQREHFRMVFEVARRAGWYDPSVTRVEHVTFGLVQGEDGQKLKSRDGTPLKLIELLNAAVRQSHAVIRTSKTLMQAEEREQKALPSFSEPASRDESRRDEEERLAERIGYAAIKYFELAHNRSSNYIFSYNAMLSFKGNTAVYLLYAFTRIRSIRRQLSSSLGSEQAAVELELSSKAVVPNLGQKEEKELALILSQFPDVVLAMESRLQPHLMCDYLYKLSGKFHLFYERCKVLGNDQTPSRLQLCFAVEGVMERGLRLLGITPIEKM